jgi:hypothetical protein
VEHRPKTLRGTNLGADLRLKTLSRTKWELDEKAKALAEAKRMAKAIIEGDAEADLQEGDEGEQQLERKLAEASMRIKPEPFEE